MRKTVPEIIRAVRTCIDEIAVNDAEFYTEKDSEELDTIIEQKIVDGVRFVHGTADEGMLTPDAFITEKGETASIDDDLVGRVVLPENFMRLCYAGLSSWVMHVNKYVLWTDKEYAMLKDPYSTGTWERPKLALRGGGQKVLELYKAREKTDAFDIGFISEPELTEENGEKGITVSEKLWIALVYYISGLTLLTLKDEHADSMFNQALTLMGVSPTASVNDETT